MISPWMEKGTLMEYLKNAGEASVNHKGLVSVCHPELTTLHNIDKVVDIASGLEYLHSQSFAHGDLHGVSRRFILRLRS
jgi:serine/threonine protein kinase